MLVEFETALKRAVFAFPLRDAGTTLPAECHAGFEMRLLSSILPIVLDVAVALSSLIDY